MRLSIVFLVLFFIEIILETGPRLAYNVAPGVSVKNVLIFSFFLVAIVNWYTEPAVYKDKQYHKLLLFFSIVILYSLFSLSMPSVLGAENFDIRYGLLNLKNQLVDSVLCFVIFWLFTKKHLKSPDIVAKSMVIVVAVCCVLTLVEAKLPSLNLFGFDDGNRRVNGPFGEPNQTAAVLSLFLPLSISLIFVRGKDRILYAAAALCMLACILITSSRGGLLGALTGSLYLVWTIRARLALSNKILMIISAPVIAILAWLLVPEYYRELLLSRVSFVSESKIDWREASSGRTRLWDMGLMLWKQSPLFGQGWASFKMQAGGSASHSIYLSYLVGLGVVGLALFLTLYWKLFRFYQSTIRFYSTRHSALPILGISAGLIALLVSLAFINLYKPWIPVWCLLGTMAGYCSALKTTARVKTFRSKARSAGTAEGKQQLGGSSTISAT